MWTSGVVVARSLPDFSRFDSRPGVARSFDCSLKLKLCRAPIVFKLYSLYSHGALFCSVVLKLYSIS